MSGGYKLLVIRAALNAGTPDKNRQSSGHRPFTAALPELSGTIPASGYQLLLPYPAQNSWLELP